MTIVHVVNLNYNLSNGIKSVLSELVPHQMELSHRVVVINLRKNETSVFSSECYVGDVKDFIRVVGVLKPDIVVFHGGYEIKFYLFAIELRKLKVQYIVTPHGGTSRYNLQRKKIQKIIVNKLFTERFISQSSGVVFLNEQERNNSIFCRRIHDFAIVPNGVSTRMVDKDMKLKSPKIRFIFLSRIDIKYKGLDLLLKAITSLATEHPSVDFDFHFYGSRYDAEVVRQFEELVKATEGPVFYHGEVLGIEKDRAYEEAHIYVLPSLSEGMPVTVLEALSFGNPCVVTPQTNMAELIENYHAGWVSEPNVESLTCTLLRAYQEYSKNRMYYINNALEAVKQYDWQSIASKSVCEYLRLLQSSKYR